MARKISLVVVSVASVVLIVVALRTVVAASGRSSTAAPGNTAVVPVPPETAQTLASSPLKISAADLYKAYDLNAVAANDEYSGRKLEVSGVVYGRNGARSTGGRFSLSVDQVGLESVDVTLRDGQSVAPSRLRNGDAVTIECDQVQRSRGTLSLSNCILASGENSSTGE